MAAGVRSWLPVEVHGLTLECLTEATGNFHDFTGPWLGSVFVKKVTEVGKAAPGGVGTVDDSPPFFGVPLPDCSYQLHISNLALSIGVPGPSVKRR